MIKNLTTRIREQLRLPEYRAGLTSGRLKDLCEVRDYQAINRALGRMPDAYIDRWEDAKTPAGRHAAVWRVVIPPPNCPPPEKRL